MTRIAYLVSSATEITMADGTTHPTGYFAEEALKPYDRFVAAGFDVVVVTPDGQAPTADPYGLNWFFHYPEEDKDYLNSVVRTFAVDPDDIRFTLHQASELGLAAARRLAEAMQAKGLSRAEVDLADNPDVGRLLVALHAKRAPIASLCHGPALLLSAPERPDGQWLFDGYRLTCFTDEEEDQTEPGKLGLPWYVDTALKNAGAVFDDGPAAWASHVVVDRHIITGQNPGSTEAVADAVIKALTAAATEAA